MRPFFMIVASSRTAVRRCPWPSSTSGSKPSDLADSTNRSANAFRLGLLRRSAVPCSRLQTLGPASQGESAVVDHAASIDGHAPHAVDRLASTRAGHAATLRRTYSSWTYDKGPADSGDPIMGHAKVDMTINVCTQVLDGAALDAATRVGSELVRMVQTSDPMRTPMPAESWLLRLDSNQQPSG